VGAPTSLLGNARGFARDFPRDKMPSGYLWDIVDFVPLIIDAQLTGRGGWKWGSNVMTGDPETGIYAPFLTGDKLLVQTTDGKLFEVNPTTFAVTLRGSLPRAIQNPVQLVDTVIHFDKTGVVAPKLITSPGGVPTVNPIAAGHLASPVGTVYKSMLVTGGAGGETNVIRFSNPNYLLSDPLSFQPVSRYATNLPVTALAALRAVVLVFHGGSVERIRGSQPAIPGDVGDMFVESLFDRAGCVDPLTIAYWNDNCVFADEHGVHMTDGSIVRNIVSQGGILYYWRQLYEFKSTMAACTFLDYYIITIRRSDGAPPVTLVVDLNKRQWFRLSNIPALCYVASSSGQAMERVWAGLAGTTRLARIGPCFFPAFGTSAIKDDDGTNVLPTFETPWYRLGQEGRKRIRFAYLSYDARVPTSIGRSDVPAGWRYGGDEAGPEPAVLDQIAELAAQQVVSLGYVRSPQDPAYTALGTLPDTNQYTRFRLPIGQNPYGIAFKVAQIAATSVLRIFDLGVEDQAGERSRV
jgi:hypothetical protein